ncbi:hypothetical protein JCGZ_02257 [Jatropha curcas]|uniref:Uncharacterized protein n=2 Tax=Jatropha curcas TaxID=180498 RepID=A0A067L866_JATCU|nr:hypothetical protein JCGZ_02257 [Jatropha curcas]
MRQNGVCPDKHTFPLLFKSFSKLKNENPFQFYTHIVKYGLEFNNFVRNSLITALATGGYIASARQVFDESPQRDSITWTAMIDGYTRNGFPAEGLKCFKQMRSMGLKVDEVTVVSALSAAGMTGDIWFGRWVHGFYVEQLRVKCDVFVGSALVDMYSKCGYYDEARRVFDVMPIKNVVSWSALIAGYVQCNRFKDALLLFQDMLMADVRPNQSTLTCVLTASAQLGALDQGRWVHHYIDRNFLGMNSITGTALIDMYAKCGCVGEALLVFHKLPVKNVYTWTAMINALAMHGDALSALNLFYRMSSSGVQPNGVTFIGVLSACAHGGLVDEGRRLFEMMRHIYHLEPNVDHYGCMVDLLGRAGYLDEARKLIEEMPMEPTPGVWGALFGACMIHKAFDLGEYVGKHLIRLQPNHSGRYALLANMYSAYDRWDAAAYVRKIMKGKGIEKKPGFSWIEVNGLIHEFIAFDGSHSESSYLYEMLDNIMVQLKLADHLQETMLLTAETE